MIEHFREFYWHFIVFLHCIALSMCVFLESSLMFYQRIRKWKKMKLVTDKRIKIESKIQTQIFYKQGWDRSFYFTYFDSSLVWC